mmetsp:Transcript_87478/g.138958  ORF Transcript_87478/g.138958 Transcript_87478/m.138958 type:complete len:227 (-) Transcript_87478:885-1565(-)
MKMPPPVTDTCQDIRVVLQARRRLRSVGTQHGILIILFIALTCILFLLGVINQVCMDPSQVGDPRVERFWFLFLQRKACHLRESLRLRHINARRFRPLRVPDHLGQPSSDFLLACCGCFDVLQGVRGLNISPFHQGTLESSGLCSAADLFFNSCTAFRPPMKRSILLLSHHLVVDGLMPSQPPTPFHAPLSFSSRIRSQVMIFFGRIHRILFHGLHQSSHRIHRGR